MILTTSVINTVLNFVANVFVLEGTAALAKKGTDTSSSQQQLYQKNTSYILLIGDHNVETKIGKLSSSPSSALFNNSETTKADKLGVKTVEDTSSSSIFPLETTNFQKYENNHLDKTSNGSRDKRETKKEKKRKKPGRKNYENNFLTTTTSKPQEDAFLNDMTWDDATWILTASFIIFTMQTGFGMLESGCVSVRNESNIMMKNFHVYVFVLKIVLVVDVVFGGLTYWLFGFSISFGTDAGSSPYFGVGEYLVDSDKQLMGPVFAAFMFQLSFATTATTIVSGTMAERCNFKAYCVFSMLNTIVYCVPARWIWGPTGFLGELGVIDIAGSGAVHLLGGASGFFAAWMLGPRLGRYENGPASLPLGNPSSCIVGLYILWWGWLAFNSGSTFGVSGQKWKFAARAAVTTLIASIGGGMVGSVWTLLKPGRKFEVMDIVNPVLGALVGITAGCALFRTIDAFIVGAVGGAIVIMTNGIPDRLRVDDPVGATSVHAFAGLWGLVAVALFAEDDSGLGFTKGHSGVLRGGTFYLLKVQLLAAACITVWSIFITVSLLWIINMFVPIRMEPHEELLGADFLEHLVYRRHAGLSPALSALGSHPDICNVHRQAVVIGSNNPIHGTINDTIKNVGASRLWKKLKTKTIVASAFMKVLNDMNGQRVADKPPSARRRLSATESVNIVHEILGTPFTITREVPNGHNAP